MSPAPARVKPQAGVDRARLPRAELESAFATPPSRKRFGVQGLRRDRPSTLRLSGERAHALSKHRWAMYHRR